MSDQGGSDPFAVLPGLSPPMEPAPATPVWLPLIIARRLLGPAAGLARGLTFTALAWELVGLVKDWGLHRPRTHVETQGLGWDEALGG